MVRLAIGSLRVPRPKEAGLMVRLPMGDDGEPAIEADAETWAAIQQAAIGAVAANPAAQEHLFGPELRKLSKAAAKARAAL